MQHNRWDNALTGTAQATGRAGPAGDVLLRKAADQAGLSAQLAAALPEKGDSPAFDRGAVLTSLAAAIALGATSERHRPARAPGPRARGRAQHAAGGVIGGDAVGLADGGPCLVRDQAAQDIERLEPAGRGWMRFPARTGNPPWR